jgi:hypothetical protein
MADIHKRKKALTLKLMVPPEAFWIRRRVVEESDQKIPYRMLYPLMFPEYYYRATRRRTKKEKEKGKKKRKKKGNR